MALGIVTSIKNNINTIKTHYLKLSQYTCIVGIDSIFNISIDTLSDGEIYIINNNPKIILAEMATSRQIRLTGIAYGKVKITIIQKGNSEYATDTVDLFCNVGDMDVDTKLENNSWDTIKIIASEGLGPTYWSVGDMKSIILNGNVGDDCVLDNFECNVFIAHFNYQAINGNNDPPRTDENNIIFCGFKNKDGMDLALANDNSTTTTYKTDGTLLFNMNHWGTSNNGGWMACDLRYDILGAIHHPPDAYGSSPNAVSVRAGYNASSVTLTSPVANTLMAALPVEFRNVLRLFKRALASDEHEITIAYDAISLLSETEVIGSRKNADTYENPYFNQLDYFHDGNGRKRYRHNKNINFATSAKASWWLGSIANKDSKDNGFCYVDLNGDYTTSEHSQSSYARGLVPIFKI